MKYSTLQAELERLFDLDEMLNLSRSLLGLSPELVGGASAAGSFAAALTSYCAASESLEALCDAMLAAKPGASPKLLALAQGKLNLVSDVQVGETVGDYALKARLGSSQAGDTYLATDGQGSFRVKILRRSATRDRAGLNRLLTLNRWISSLREPGLPRIVSSGSLGERIGIVQRAVEGQTLADRLQQGPVSLGEAIGIIRAIALPLSALHEHQVSHGNLKPENVLLHGSDGSKDALLLDAGLDRLLGFGQYMNGSFQERAFSHSPRTTAPEQIRGLVPEVRSDLYALGAIFYELLAGEPLFVGRSVFETLRAHLEEAPPAPSSKANAISIASQVDELVLSLLSKRPEDRPGSLAQLLNALDDLDRARSRRSIITEEQLQERIDELLSNPTSRDAALLLESTLEDGADPIQIGTAFLSAAESLPDEDRVAKKSLYHRAARFFETGAKDLARSEAAYRKVLELDSGDAAARSSLNTLLKKLGRHEEVLESLLSRVEAASARLERGRLLAEMAQIYRDELSDRDQAIFAYTQAYCEAPEEARYGDQLEELLRDDVGRYQEALAALGTAASEAQDADAKVSLLCRAGDWYLDKVKADDLALACYQSAIALAPAHIRALSGMARIYRRAKQWPELTMVLARWADAVAAPAERRNLQAEAAQLHEIQLNDPQSARALYEQMLAEDPSHAVGAAGLLRMLEQAQDYRRLSEVLAERAKALTGDAKVACLLSLAELFQDRLAQDDAAAERYREVLKLDPQNLDALRGLDRLFSRAGRYGELLDNLRAQLAAAATPRQKITLLERLAAIYDEEFLNHQEAASAWEAVLEIDDQHEQALVALGRHYRALDRWEDLAQLLERQVAALSDQGRRIDILLSLGRLVRDELSSDARATTAFERVLSLDPENQQALEALAQLQETSGDADRALSSLLALADKATEPRLRTEHLMRAARLMETRKENDRQIQYLEEALAATPGFAPATEALVAAYLRRNEASAAVEVLARQIEHTSGDQEKAELWAQMAHLTYEHSKNADRVFQLAQKAASLHTENLLAQATLGHLAYDSQHFLEASNHYRSVAARIDRLPKAQAASVLTRYLDSLNRTGSLEEAVPIVDTLRRLAPDDKANLFRVAAIMAEHGSSKKAVETYRELFSRFGQDLLEDEAAKAHLHFGVALSREKLFSEAVAAFERAAELDIHNADALDAWARALEELEDWEQAIRVREQELDLVTGEKHIDLLVHIGDIVASKLADRPRAAGLLVSALEQRPDDRRLLTKLMQLYSEEKDWEKLVDIVLRLAGFVDDPKQKAKYLQTAAIATQRELRDPERALELYEQALGLDAGLDRAEQEAVAICRATSNFAELERLLKRRLKGLSQAQDHEKMLAGFLELGELYEKELNAPQKAIDAYEAARTLSPSNGELLLHLSELYTTDLEKHFQKARECHSLILQDDPFRKESYKALCRLYTKAKHPDATWCVCQALTVLEFADADEERFFNRMRAESAIVAQRALQDPDWLDLMHSKADPLLTSLFALIEPAIVARRGSDLRALGYDPAHTIDLGQHPATLAQVLSYAASVLGVPEPPAFENPNEPGGLLFLHAQRPSVVLGSAALSAELPPQPAAFVAGRHLSYFRPGLYVRQLVPTGTGLKAWLFAAIRLIAPKFPVAPELEGAVAEAQSALDVGLRGPSRDQLTRVVNKVLQSAGSLDLKNWVAGVDLTADRMGFLLCDDLKTALEIVRASDESISSVSKTDRYRELVLFSVSEAYLKARFDLGVALEG